MTAIVAALGDTHCNSYFGLCPPYFEHPGGKHIANPAQRILWRHWKGYIERVAAVKAEHNAPLITVLNGDVCDNDNARSSSFIVYSDTQMMRLTYAALRSLLDISDKVYVVNGTPSHTRSFEDKFGEDVGAENDGVSFAKWSWKLNVEGVRIWFGHHGPMGRLPHTFRMAGTKLAADTMAKCALMRPKRRPPDVIFRSHQHRWSDSFDNYDTRGVYLAAWQLPTPYIYRLDADAQPEVGGVIMVCENGRYSLEKYRASYSVEREVKVVL